MIQTVPVMIMMETQMKIQMMMMKTDESQSQGLVNQLHHHKGGVTLKMDRGWDKEEISTRPFLEGEKDDKNSRLESSTFEDP